MPDSNLTRDEARARAALISDVTYDIQLDMTSEDHPVVETVARFAAGTPGSQTFLEYASAEIQEATLNGQPLPAGAHDGVRLTLDDLGARNELRVRARGEYSRTGVGLNRFRDPVDGRIYAYTDFEPFDAHLVYPCFDQPDLKARFRFTVVAPEGWIARANTAPAGEPERIGDALRWVFEETEPIPTYIAAVLAGEYHEARDRHGEIDLALYCRQSLAEHLEADEWFEITKQGLDFFQEHFATPYPFGKYDQAVVPEFGAGAMENPGLVTFHERYIFRSNVTATERELRAGTLLHEMAHMWFGDLVTMRWWDDLWLNESFASYMGVLSEVEATRFSEGWAIFANYEKTWALQQDQLPTTHPIVSDIPDVQSVHLNFDGITYAKGASVLKQLVAWVGLDRFMEAMKVYFARHEWGNAELKDFLAVLEESSGRDLDAWSREWLQTAGVNTIAPRYEERDGRFRGFHLVQHEPPTGGPLRSHRVAVGLYHDDGGRLVRRERVELDLVGASTEVGDLQGSEVPPLVIVNDDDLTFSKVRFDPRSIATLRQRLGDIDDSLARAVCWTACWDMARDGEIPAREFLEIALRHGPREGEVGSLERVLAQAQMAVNLYGDPAHREEASDRMASVALGEARQASPGSERQLAWARAFAATVRTDADLQLARDLLVGTERIEGLEIDTEFRWLLVQALAAAGVADADALIEAELGRDPTDMGVRHAAAARAARPSGAAKSEAWRSVLEDRSLTLAHCNAVMRGFQQAGQESLLEQYVDPYLETLPKVWEERDLEFALDFGQAMFPVWVISTDTIEHVERALAARPAGPLQRMLLEGNDRIRRALRTRDVDRQAGGR